MRFKLLKLIFTIINLKHTLQQSSGSTPDTSTVNLENTINCGSNKCVANAGICVNFAQSNCTCINEYTTFPNTSIIKCNYEKKKQQTAFFLELFVSYGSGHFYLNNVQFAIPKFLFWFIGYYLFIVLRVIFKQKEDEDPNKNTFATISIVLGFIFLILMLIWQIVDLVFMGLNEYTDGNNIEVLSWSK